jgi:UDP-N-acetylglucosamine 2-epimerase (non-hydrolysing)
MKILHVVGARPNFMKVAPVMAAFSNNDRCEQTLVHTGQHYDSSMSDVFFKQLTIPQPDYNLGVGSGSHAFQTAEIMKRFESVVLEENPDLVLVYGDVNSTAAAALVCSKLWIRVGHVEAGLRSNDRKMPEEINRIVTDSLSDFLFTPSRDADKNLLREGVEPRRIFMVGNVMIDTLVRLLPIAERKNLPASIKLNGRPLVLVTLHRPSNVDDAQRLKNILDVLNAIAEKAEVLFPVHPRTQNAIKSLGEMRFSPYLQFSDPVGYLEFLKLQCRAAAVITDSGGIQEETTYLGIPCLTVRENTERPATVEIGTNILVGGDMDLLKTEVERALSGEWKTGSVPPLWDGMAGHRIANAVLQQILSSGCTEKRGQTFKFYPRSSA